MATLALSKTNKNKKISKFCLCFNPHTARQFSLYISKIDNTSNEKIFLNDFIEQFELSDCLIVAWHTNNSVKVPFCTFLSSIDRVSAKNV